MHLRTALALASALMLAHAARGADPADAGLADKIDHYLAARTALGQFSGVVLVANREGVIFQKACGYANLELRVANTVETTFEIASLSKAFTAAAILMLRDDGKLQLEDSVCRFLDGCDEAWKPIAIRELLHHTSGIPDYESALDMGSAKYADAMALSDAPRRQVDEARAKPLDFPPGTKFNYSNTGYLLLGFVIEKASGQSFEDYLRAKIFNPLNLEATGVIDRLRIQNGRADGYTGMADMPIERLVAGYPLLGGPFARAMYTRLPSPEGDGGLYSDAGDLYRWVTALDGGKLLSEASRKEMMTPQLGSYGTGWFTRTRFGRTLRTHTGVLPGFVSIIDRFEEGELTVIVLSNIDTSRTSRIANAIEQMGFHLPYDTPVSHKIVSLAHDSAAPLIGKYKLEDGRIVTIAEGRRFLEAALPGQYIAGILPESARQFYMPLGEGTFTFSDEPAHALTLIMHYDGNDLVAHRTE